MAEQQFAELYRDDNTKAARSIFVEIKDGLVTFVQQDTGPLCEEMYRDSDYERVIFNLPAAQLKSAFGAKTDNELFALLRRDYSTSDAFDRFLSYLYDSHLKYDYYSG